MTVGEQDQIGWEQGLDGWRRNPEWWGLSLGIRPERLENKSKTVRKLHRLGVWWMLNQLKKGRLNCDHQKK